MKFMMDDIFMRLSGRYIAGRYFMLLITFDFAFKNFARKSD
jgi:hypothetical protein